MSSSDYVPRNEEDNDEGFNLDDFEVDPDTNGLCRNSMDYYQLAFGCYWRKRCKGAE